MKLAEIAESILAHLKRFEVDTAINIAPPDRIIKPYFQVNAWAGGSRVFVVYVSFQGAASLTKTEALNYLVWLNSGNVGKHWRLKACSPTVT